MRIRALFLLLFLIPTLALANQKLTIALDWYVNPDHAAILVAQAKGYFRENGLDVRLISPVAANEPIKMVSSGDADIAVSYEPAWIIAQHRGLKLAWVATLFGQPLETITSLKKGGIKKLQDLKGKRFGYEMTSMGRLIISTMLKNVGVQPSQVHFISLQMSLEQALLTRHVAALSGFMRNVEVVQLGQKGYAVKTFNPEDYGVPSFAELVLLEKPGSLTVKTLNAFRRALRQATLYAVQNPKRSWRLVQKRYHYALASTPSMAKTNHAIWMATLPLMDKTPGVFNQTQYRHFEAFLKRNRVISG